MSRKFLIVDDEKNSRDYLADLIKEYNNEANIVGSAANATDALKLVKEYVPDVIFLDVKMPGKTGMELLEAIKNKERFKVVFITAYSEFAIRAIKEEAFDYLLKPIDKEEFFVMMKRLEGVLHAEELKSSNTEEYEQASIAIYHNNGFRLIKLSDIAYIEASNNYSNIKLSKGGNILVSRPLKEFENRLNKKWFFRIHKSYIINMHYIKEYVTEDGGKVILQNNEEIYVSKYKLRDFFEFISRLTNGLKA